MSDNNKVISRPVSTLGNESGGGRAYGRLQEEKC